MSRDTPADVGYIRRTGEDEQQFTKRLARDAETLALLAPASPRLEAVVEPETAVRARQLADHASRDISHVLCWWHLYVPRVLFQQARRRIESGAVRPLAEIAELQRRLAVWLAALAKNACERSDVTGQPTAADVAAAVTVAISQGGSTKPSQSRKFWYRYLQTGPESGMAPPFRMAGPEMRPA